MSSTGFRSTFAFYPVSYITLQYFSFCACPCGFICVYHYFFDIVGQAIDHQQSFENVLLLQRRTICKFQVVKDICHVTDRDYTSLGNLFDVQWYSRAFGLKVNRPYQLSTAPIYVVNAQSSPR